MALPFVSHPDDCPGCIALLQRAQTKRLERRAAERQRLLVRQIIASQRERLEALQEPHPVPMPALVTLDGDISDGTLTIVRPKRKRTKKVEKMPEP